MKQIAFVLFASALLAQPPGFGGGFPGRSGDAAASFTELKAALGLSDAQVTSLQQIQTQTRQASQTIAQQLATKQTALRDSLTKGTTALAAGTALLEIEALRKQLETNQTSARNQASGVLSADQRTKLKTLEDAAKLQPAIGQATALGLLARPATATGTPGPGFGGFGMGGMRGMRGGSRPDSIQ